MSTHQVSTERSKQAAPVRSVESRAFEAMWRGLRHGAMIPRRSEFDPRAAVPFLKNIVLLDVPQFAGDVVRMRLVGTAFEARIQKSITGVNYLDHLPEQFHRGALESMRLLFAQPCGLWQIMTMHYERMFAESLEVTVFPLSADTDRPGVVVSLVNPIAQPAEPNPTHGMPMRADTASYFEFLDIGAGVPHWPPQR